jgi:hypothetical protein
MKYYFINQHDENCTSKEGVIEHMKLLGLSELEVNEAERLYIDCEAWCKVVGLPTEIGECGKQCEDYKPRNGKSGCCLHYSKVFYECSEKKVKIKIETVI